LLGFIVLATMIGGAVGLLMCISPAKRQTGKTVALGSVACFVAKAVVLGARGPSGPAAPPTAATGVLEPKPENLSRSQVLANFRMSAVSWHKEAFGSVMVASFTLHNDNPMPLKDIEVTCASSGPSGSIIDKNTRTVYEVIRQRSLLQVDKLNMGFIRTETTNTQCRVTSYSRV
jgi:hypothetical protein